MKAWQAGVVIGGIVVLGAVFSVERSGAQAPADRAALEKAILANEHKIQEAIAKGDAKTAQAMVAAESWSVDPGGFTPASEFFKAVAGGMVKISKQSITDVKFLWVDANTAIIGYTWTGVGSFMGQPFPSPTHATTVWTRRGANWVGVMHQETAAAPPQKK